MSRPAEQSAEDEAPPRGLPGPLPAGESILWQGGPSAAAIRRGPLHLRLLVLYFAAAAVFVAGIAWSEGRSLAQLAISLGSIAAACLAVLALARGYAALVARTSVYTITNRRVVMRIGVALPITLNLPFASVVGAGLRLDRDGAGDIPLKMGGTGRIAFLHLWPHARPWRVSPAEPMLRGVPDAAQVAAILARALGTGDLGRIATARAEDASNQAACNQAAARPSAAA
jgi:hypothetical protein